MEVPQEVQTKYIERRKQEFEQCTKWLINHEYHELERIGHKLKGSASTFGHNQLAEIGLRLEKVSKGKDSAQVKSVLIDLKQWLDKNIPLI